MQSPYLGQIFMFGFSFPPKGYANCSGQLLSIQQNTALFSILGTFYGGNGVNNFGLPDLRGRTYLGQGQGLGLSDYTIGQIAGTENKTLLAGNLPSHTHAMNVSNAAATSGTPSTTTALSQGPVSGTTLPMYSTVAPNATMAAGEIGNAGSNLPVSILQPYLCVNFSIALIGIFPTRN